MITHSPTTRLIWTKRALERHSNGQRDPMHTISAPNIAEVYEGYVQQFRSGTPWALVDAENATVASGIA